MMLTVINFIKGASGSSQTRLVVLVTAALTVIGVVIFAAQPWGGGNTAQAEDPPRICDFFPDYFLCEPTITLTPSNTPTITNTPTQTLTPTNTLTPTLTPTFIEKDALSRSSTLPKAIIGGSTGDALLTGTQSECVGVFKPGLDPSSSTCSGILPVDGVVTNLHVRLVGSISAPAIYTFTFMPLFSPPLQCKIVGSSDSCANDSACAEVLAGDLVNVVASPENDPPPRAMTWSAVFTPNAGCPAP